MNVFLQVVWGEPHKALARLSANYHYQLAARMNWRYELAALDDRTCNTWAIIYAVRKALKTLKPGELLNFLDVDAVVMDAERFFWAVGPGDIALAPGRGHELHTGAIYLRHSAAALKLLDETAAGRGKGYLRHLEQSALSNVLLGGGYKFARLDPCFNRFILGSHRTNQADVVAAFHGERMEAKLVGVKEAVKRAAKKAGIVSQHLVEGERPVG